MIPLDLHYQWPAAAYLILLSAVALLLFYRLYLQRAHLPFWPEITFKGPSWLFWLKSSLTAAALMGCTLALMQPIGKGHYPEEMWPAEHKMAGQTASLQLKRKAHRVILLADASASMSVKDAPLKKSRLEYAKEIMDELIASLTGESLALYSFTTKALKLVPPTNDYIFGRLTLEEIQINEGGYPGTDLFNALNEIKSDYFPTQSSHRPSSQLLTLIILSDGGDTSLEAALPAEQAGKRAQIAKLVNNASDYHLRVYAIGMGSKEGGIIPNLTKNGKEIKSFLESELLEEIAKEGQGKYYEANRLPPMQLVKELLADRSKDAMYYEEQEQKFENALLRSLLGGLIYQRYFQIPTALALIFLALALFLPDRLRGTFLFLFFLGSLPMAAQTPTLLEERDFTPPLQIAKAYNQAGLFDEALSVYDNLLLLPLNHYQRVALKFNRGTTYLLEGSWDLAINALHSLASEKNLPNYLSQRINKNLALAYYGQAEKILPQDPAIALFFIKKSRSYLERLPKKLKEHLENPIKQYVAQISLIVTNDQLYEASAQALLQDIENGLDDNLIDLSLMTQVALSTDLLSQYCNLFADELKQWLPIWELTKEKLTENLLQAAYVSYLKMIKLCEDEQLKEAAAAGEASQKELIQAMEKIAGSYLLKEKIRQLINKIERNFTSKRPPLNLIQKIEGLYQEAMTLAQQKEIKTPLHESKLHFKKAGEDRSPLAMKQAQTKLSLFWLKLALVKAPEQKSLDILKMLITLQEGLQAVQQNNQIEKGALNDSQEAIVSLAQLYTSVLISEQAKAYNEGQCQATPWNSVVPSFEEGLTAANQASSSLKADANDAAAAWQALAIASWQKALNEIDHPASQANSCFAEEEAQDSSQAGNRRNNLANLLQMEMEDRQPSPEPVMQANGARPW